MGVIGWLWLLACAPLADHDGDGLVAADDCDDEDSAIFPGADETIGDGVDQDCDGFETCFTDADGDGFHGDLTVEDADLSCAAEADATMAGGDCADDDAVRNPGVAEVCDASDVDDDCDGLVDGDDPDVAGCFDWAGTYTGSVDVQYGIDHAFGAECTGTVTVVVDAAGAFTITGECTLTAYADELGPQSLTGTGATTGGYLATGTLEIGGMSATWNGDFRPEILTVTTDGIGMENGHSVQFEGGFIAYL
jgi:hypothetical protein